TLRCETFRLHGAALAARESARISASPSLASTKCFTASARSGEGGRAASSRGSLHALSRPHRCAVRNRFRRGAAADLMHVRRFFSGSHRHLHPSSPDQTRAAATRRLLHGVAILPLRVLLRRARSSREATAGGSSLKLR